MNIYLESIALDVVSTQGYTELNMFTITAFNSFHFYASIYTVCESLTAYVLSTIAYNRDISVLLFETLVALNRAPTNWAGTETFNQCLMVSVEFSLCWKQKVYLNCFLIFY